MIPEMKEYINKKNDKEFIVMIALSNEGCEDCNKKIRKYAMKKAVEEYWPEKKKIIFHSENFLELDEFQEENTFEEQMEQLEQHDKLRFKNFAIQVKQLLESDAVIFIENFGIFQDLKLLVEIANEFNKEMIFIERKW